MKTENLSKHKEETLDDIFSSSNIKEEYFKEKIIEDAFDHIRNNLATDVNLKDSDNEEARKIGEESHIVLQIFDALLTANPKLKEKLQKHTVDAILTEYDFKSFNSLDMAKKIIEAENKKKTSPEDIAA